MKAVTGWVCLLLTGASAEVGLAGAENAPSLVERACAGQRVVNGVVFRRRRGPFGRIDPTALTADADSVIAAALGDTLRCAGFGAEIEVRVVSEDRQPDGSRSFEFLQHVRGVPVQAHHTIDIDDAGRIVDANVIALAAERVPFFSVAPEEAVSVARRTAAEHSGVTAHRARPACRRVVERIDAPDGCISRHYRLQSGLPAIGVAAAPFYEIRIDVSTTPFGLFGKRVVEVEVDASSGAARVVQRYVE